MIEIKIRIFLDLFIQTIPSKNFINLIDKISFIDSPLILLASLSDN